MCLRRAYSDDIGGSSSAERFAETEESKQDKNKCVIYHYPEPWLRTYLAMIRADYLAHQNALSRYVPVDI